MSIEDQRQRECLSKVRYVTITEAEGLGDFLNRHSSDLPELSVYQCPWCTGFHLTSAPRHKE